MSSDSFKKKSALFLDRDGVINIEKNYVYSIEDFEFVEGIFDLCRYAIDKDMVVIVVTNQSGIGRGLYNKEQFNTLTAWMKARFEKESAPLNAVYFCPDHPEFGVGKYRRNSFDRKPNPGMLLRAERDFGLDLRRSIMIGDKPSDIHAAKKAGVGVSLLFGSDRVDSNPDGIIKTLYEAMWYF